MVDVCCVVCGNIAAPQYIKREKYNKAFETFGLLPVNKWKDKKLNLSSPSLILCTLEDCYAASFEKYRLETFGPNSPRSNSPSRSPSPSPRPPHPAVDAPSTLLPVIEISNEDQQQPFVMQPKEFLCDCCGMKTMSDKGKVYVLLF